MRDVTRSYDGRLTLKDGRLDLCPGEIHALIGANGAGKSTMMNILYGILERDGGSIMLEGREVHFRNAAEAQAAGIFMLHQELNIIKDLTVAQNIFLGRERMKGLSTDDKAMTAECARLLEAVGLDIDPSAKMGTLSPGQQRFCWLW